MGIVQSMGTIGFWQRHLKVSHIEIRELKETQEAQAIGRCTKWLPG